MNIPDTELHLQDYSELEHTYQVQPGLTGDRMVESFSRYQILRRERGLGQNHFPHSADHEEGKDW